MISRKAPRSVLRHNSRPLHTMRQKKPQKGWYVATSNYSNLDHIQVRFDCDGVSSYGKARVDFLDEK